MRSRLPFTAALSSLGAALFMLTGCGGGGSTSTPSRGTMSLTLVDGPSPDYRAINLNVQSVQVHQSSSMSGSGWVTVSNPNRTIDLLSLQGGVVASLAANQTLNAGSYEMLRLVLGAGNTLTLSDGSVVDLEVPSGLQTGIKIPLSFSVKPGTTADVWVDFDGAHSIHVNQTGSTKYILRPVVHGFMKIATGSVSGTVSGSAGAPLGGSLVMAERVEANGDVTILRSTTTDLNGHYTLDLLPLDQTFYVVTQPVAGGLVYEASASAALMLTAASATASADLSCALALSAGSVGGVLTPIASAIQSDTVYLLQTLSAGGSGNVRLAVATVNAVVGVSSESYSLVSVPAGAYQVQGERATLNADGSISILRSSASAAFAVTASATATQDIAF